MPFRLGVLTSGGDCSGLNAAIRAVVHRAKRGYGFDVIGIEDGSVPYSTKGPAAGRLMQVVQVRGIYMGEEQ